MTDAALLAYRLNASYLIKDWPLAAGVSYGRESRNNGGETGQHLAMRIEGAWDTLFVAFLYGPAGLEYADRSVAKRSGNVMAFELGARGELPVPWLDVEGCLEWRRTTYDKEDGTTLGDKVVRVEVLPMAGLVFKL